jgi:glycosyltransferase involved in cell wall biosynthesis
MSLRLGFHYHIPAHQVNDDIIMPGYLGRFIDSIAEHCLQVTCFLHSPRPEERQYLDYKITSPHVRLVTIGDHASVPRRLLQVPRILHIFKKYQHLLDVLLIRGPTPLLPFFAHQAHSTKVVLLIVGDYLSEMDGLKQPSWRKEAIRLWSLWNKRQQLRIARNTLTFVNSRLLYDEMAPVVRNLKEVRTATLGSGDFYVRHDVCQTSPVRLLYTGRISRAKGVLDCVETLAHLVKQGKDVVLDLVGWPQEGDPILEEISTLAQQRGVDDKVMYHGYQPLGPQLFSYYQNADIYLLASKAEGFPRTIWEAMAHSLPVVATRVGSIPDYVGDGALLIDSSDQLTDAVLRLMNEPALRQTLIKSGRDLVAANTVENQAASMMNTINYWFASGRV